MTKQTKKCQAHYSCVEHNIMYKAQFSMRKRNGSPTYKPGAERRLREAQGQQKDEALIKEGGEDYYAFFMLMWILNQEMQITVVMILMLYNETFNQMRIARKTIKTRKPIRTPMNQVGKTRRTVVKRGTRLSSYGGMLQKG